MRALGLVVILAACGRIDFEVGGPAAACTEPWSAATVLDLGVPQPRGPSISGDDLDLYFSDAAQGELWSSHRAARTDPFPPATRMPSPPNTNYADSGPSISGDGLDLCWDSGRGGNAVYVQSHRASTTAAWLPDMDTAARGDGDISFDGLTAYMQDYLGPILVLTRATRTDTFTLVGPLGSLVNDGSINRAPSISADERDLYFTSDRDGSTHVWVAHRADAAGELTSVERLATPEAYSEPDISADGHHLYFVYDDGSTTHLASTSRCE